MEEKTIYRITMTDEGDFKTLQIKKETATEAKLNTNYSRSIYFENHEDAERFMSDLINLIKKNYSKAKNENWIYTKDYD